MIATSLLRVPIHGRVDPRELPAMWERLVAVIGGCVYRRKPDAQWTMELMSDAVRDLTGYDPHRFIHNASLAFANLIAPDDRARVEDAVAAAVRERRRATLHYRLRTAYRRLLPIEDRLVPVYDAQGRVVAIEGIFDLATFGPGQRRGPAENAVAVPAA
ncbi:MAG TPA: PAS domain-containing protein [Opitutus sp.]|nr:PAS domain-containing protein [Opitutus sp.]